jgi:hypothetical protein
MVNLGHETEAHPHGRRTSRDHSRAAFAMLCRDLWRALLFFTDEGLWSNLVKQIYPSVA